MCSKLVYVKCSIVLLACLLAGIARAGERTDFVSVKDGKFFLEGKEYRYVGTNLWYGAILGSEGQGGNRQRLLQELDDMRAIGIDNVRVLIGGDGRDGIPSHIAPKLQSEPGVYNDTILAGLDYLMMQLEKRNMRAVLYFNNAWEWSGGYGAYLDWVGFKGAVQSSDGSGKMKHFDRTPVPTIEGWWEYMQYVSNFMLNDEAKRLANEHVRKMVTRVNRYTGQPYKDSKALMSWEIANEPRCFINDSLHKAKFVEWIDEQSRLIKSLDPNHLVTTGSEGKHGCEEDIELFKAIHSLPNIDYACIHIWPNNWGWIGKFNQNYDADKTIAEGAPDPIVDNVKAACDSTLAYIEEAYQALNGGVLPSASWLGNRSLSFDLHNRPIVLEEFGYPRDRFLFTPGSKTQGRDEYYRYVFDIIRTSGKIAGCNFWGWGGKANVKHTIWQRWDDYVCDPAQEEQGLNSVFACDKSTLDMIREMNIRNTQCEVSFSDTTWVWDEEDCVQMQVTLRNPLLKELKGDSLVIRICKDTKEEIAKYPFCYNNKVDGEITETITLEGLPAGFYHVFVELNGVNIVKNETNLYDKPHYIDYYRFGVSPENIVSLPDAQKDFKKFWDRARKQLAKTPIDPVVVEQTERQGEKRHFVAKLKGLDGDIVQIDYTMPRKPGRYPVHIVNMGYSCKPWDLDLSDNGWIDVIVSSRGQGRNDATNRFGDWVQFGLDNPEHYYYRGAYLDCSRAIDYLVTLPEVNKKKIFLEGGSQGGAYSMACAALDHRVTAVACYVTFMSDFPDYFKIVDWPYSAIKAKQKELGMSDEQLYRNLSYFDIKNLAPWIKCPVYLAIGLQDVTCPPHTNISGYNLLKGKKQLHFYRNYGHHVDYSHWTPSMYEFFSRF